MSNSWDLWLHNNNIFLIITLIWFFDRYNVLIIRFYRYLSLNTSTTNRHRIDVVFLQNNLWSSSHSLSTTSATINLVNRLLWLVLVIFNYWCGSRVIGAFFLTIRKLLLQLLLLLFEFSIHWISSLSNLVDELVFVHYFLRWLRFLILSWVNYWLLFLSLDLLIANFNLSCLGSDYRCVSLKCNCDLFGYLRLYNVWFLLKLLL